jgi:aminomethyltransferase
LGARDTLRLEAGLCLYGHDLDESTTPIEADLAWTIQKRRRAEGGFPGADVILAQLEQGPSRRRVGLRPEGRRPVRDGARLRTHEGQPAGIVTSGGFGPTAGHPVAMGFVQTGSADIGTRLIADVRGTEVPVTVAPLPFAPHRYFRG